MKVEKIGRNDYLKIICIGFSKFYLSLQKIGCQSLYKQTNHTLTMQSIGTSTTLGLGLALLMVSRRV